MYVTTTEPEVAPSVPLVTIVAVPFVAFTADVLNPASAEKLKVSSTDLPTSTVWVAGAVKEGMA